MGQFEVGLGFRRVTIFIRLLLAFTLALVGAAFVAWFLTAGLVIHPGTSMIAAFFSMIAFLVALVAFFFRERRE